jgi:hypothetical protein
MNRREKLLAEETGHGDEAVADGAMSQFAGINCLGVTAQAELVKPTDTENYVREAR